jgi:hypothetical protein
MLGNLQDSKAQRISKNKGLHTNELTSINRRSVLFSFAAAWIFLLAFCKGEVSVVSGGLNTGRQYAILYLLSAETLFAFLTFTNLCGTPE